MKVNLLFIAVVLYYICSCISNINAGECTKDDLRYTYTRCVNQSRWRVAVPANGCRGGTIKAPSTLYKCDVHCDSGQHLSPTNPNEHCEACPGGTYSMKNGIRFEDWIELPSGFKTYGERGDDSETSGLNCTGYTWKPAGMYIAAPSGSPCSAILQYDVHMAKEGKMTMTYKYTESTASLFTVEVQNDQCKVNQDSDQQWIVGTKADKWRTHKTKLSKGRNRVFIVLIDNSVSGLRENSKDSETSATMIKSMEFDNVAYAQHCTKCRPGTYSTTSASKCQPCKPDHYSKRGWDECKPCSSDQYSRAGSENCTKRPPCQPVDYFFVWGPCDAKSGQMSKQYSWVQPKVCTGGVTLPASGKEFQKCDSDICNVGSFRSNASACLACPAGQKARVEQTLATATGKESGQTNTEACVQCPVNSQPVYGLQYRRWWSLPPFMRTVCVTLGANDDCPTSGQWIPLGDHIRSGYGTDAWFSILELEVAGFVGSGGEYSGDITFEFQLFCKNSCKLYFMMETEGKGHFMVRSWNGKTSAERQLFRYSLRHHDQTKFMWIFDRANKPINAQDTDYAAIYAINATQVKDAPAVDCQACPMDENKKCVECPNGQYFSIRTMLCMPCPAAQVVWRTPARSEADCRSCGPGLRPHDGNSCVIDALLNTTMEDGRPKRHNLTRLMGNQTINGVRLFTTRGTEYHHVFVFNINSGLPKPKLPTCSSNLSSFGPIKHRLVQALVCQYTLVPPRKKEGRYLSAQPVSLGDQLMNVTSTNHTPEHFIAMNKRLEDAGWVRDDDNLDLHLMYVTTEPSQACTSGRSTLVTLRCDPKATTDVGEVSMPPKCPDGTCDGCNFHFMWKSRIACPICDQSDYEVVKSECVGGHQQIYYYPPKYCYFSTTDKHQKIVKTIKCPLLSSQAEIAVIVIFVVGVILVSLLGYCWKRNKRLEYKYMKLIEGKGGRPGELPQAESCAVHEGEEEEDDVHIKSSGGSSSAFFSRFKQFRKAKTYGGDRMETANLTDRDEFGI